MSRRPSLRIFINPNSILVKYSIIVLWGGGDTLIHVFGLPYIIILFIVITKAVLNKDICVIEAVLFWGENRHFPQFFG